MSIPDANGVIHGCRKNTDGSLRVIDTGAGQSCASGYTPLDWSQQGPQGLQGPPGPSGLAGLTIATASRRMPPGTGRLGVDALVPVGKVLVSGGFSFGQEHGELKASMPSMQCYPTAQACWHVEATNTSATDDLDVSAYVLYANGA